MRTLIKNETFQILAVIIGLLTLGCVILPFIVKGGCMALLYIFEHPLRALALSVAFLLGTLVGSRK